MSKRPEGAPPLKPGPKSNRPTTSMRVPQDFAEFIRRVSTLDRISVSDLIARDFTGKAEELCRAAVLREAGKYRGSEAGA